MEYVKLGSTGLDVSPVCLGCMSYGEPGRGPHPWSLDEETSRPFFRQAIEAGINFFDTANVYSAGSSEEITGRALKEQVARVAEARGLPRAQIALAWVAGHPAVTAPVIGATKPQHLDDAVAALDIRLTAAEIDQLEKPYVPHRIAGHA
jgi:aryl-alcohol dehydrogenase-like predicted oxidoreductase